MWRVVEYVTQRKKYKYEYKSYGDNLIRNFRKNNHYVTQGEVK